MPLNWGASTLAAKAAEHWKNDAILRACETAVEAVRHAPNSAHALSTAARIFGSTYQFRQAELFLAHLKAAAGNSGEGWTLAGKTYRFIRRLDAAIECFQAGLKAPQADCQALLQLAQVFERRNQLDISADFLTQFLSREPANGDALLLRAKLHGRAKEYDEAFALLTRLAQDSLLPWTLRNTAQYELASLQDDLGEYAAAWQSMLEAKQLASANSRDAIAHRDRVLPHLGRMVTEFNSQQIASWRASATYVADDRKLFLLTGLPRSGTTLLAKIIEGHPDVVGCDEFDFFSRLAFPAMLAGASLEDASLASLTGLNSQSLALQRELYAKSLAEATFSVNRAKVLIDKNPSYFPLLPAYLRLSPQSIVFVCLRDPRDILISCLFEDFPLNDFSVDFLNTEQAATRIAMELDWYIHMRDNAPEMFVESKYEDMVRFPSKVGEVAMTSIGLEWNDNQLRLADRLRKSDIFAPSYDQVSQPLHQRSLGRWKNYHSHISSVTPLLEPALKRLNYE